MNGTKYIFIALIILFACSTLPAQGILAGMVPAAPGSVENVAAVRLADNSTDSGWVQTGVPGYNCGRCVSRDCDLCAVRECDRCEPSPYVSGFHCTLYGCSWLREYGCPTCPIM